MLGAVTSPAVIISIHALLAESDVSKRSEPSSCRLFLSTLSLRRATTVTQTAEGFELKFLSTLSLRRATDCQQSNALKPLFLSTLSLRRATVRLIGSAKCHCHFYPRSPCGERHCICDHMSIPIFISIHALLAESDHFTFRCTVHTNQFLSTLSLRRATTLSPMSC